MTSVEEFQEQHPGYVMESAKVRVDSILKGATQLKPDEVIAVTAPAESGYTPLEIENPLTPGKRFLLLAIEPEGVLRDFSLERCLVLPDTPDIRAQLQKGMAANDGLRYTESDSIFVPD